VHLFCTVVLVGIGQNWGDCNIINTSLLNTSLLVSCCCHPRGHSLLDVVSLLEQALAFFPVPNLHASEAARTHASPDRASQARKMGRTAKNMKFSVRGTPMFNGKQPSKFSRGSESSWRPAMTKTCLRRWVCTYYPTSSRATPRRGSLGNYRGLTSGANRELMSLSPRRSIGCCRPARSRTLLEWRRKSPAGRFSWTTRSWTPSRHAYGASPIFAAQSTPRGR